MYNMTSPVAKSNLEVAQRTIRAALKTLSNEQQLQLLETLRFEVSQDMHIHESKMTNGTQGERVVCDHLGLRWNSQKVNGCDAWDEKDRPVEIKCFKASATRANINYVLPARKSGSTDAQYETLIRTHYLREASGGHYWVCLSHGSTQYKQHWVVDGPRFAEAVILLWKRDTDKTKFNLGGAYCKHCKTPHRVNELSRAINDTSRPLKLPIRVAQHCYNQPVKVTY